MKKWYDIKNKADKAEIWIYDVIGEDFWTGGGITAKDFQKELSEVKANQIDLHVNSPGGNVQDGVGIYNLIKQHHAKVTTYIDGWAASIASIIALSGDKIVMAENGIFMVHNPMGASIGYAKDHRHMADVQDKVAGTLKNTYMSKTHKSEEEITGLLDGETGDGTWMTAQEAFEFGFVDEISGQMDIAACAKFVPIVSMAGFKNIPEFIEPKQKKPTKKELESALRASGCTEKMAKSILARGYKEDQRHVASLSDQRDVAEPTEKIQDHVESKVVEPAAIDPVNALIIKTATLLSIGGLN